MTDLLTENARLRAALEPFAMIADLIDEETEGVSTTDEFGLFFLNGESDEPVWLAERFSVQKFKEARTALATPATDAVQEAARDTDLLLDAYKGLLVLHRLLDKIGLQAGVKTTNDLADRIVAAHPEFPGRAALRAIAEGRG